jgi:agmatinase
MEDFDPELERTPSEAGIYTAPPLEPHIGGPEHMMERVAEAVGWYAAQGKLVAMLGGDHSLTPGAVQDVAKHHRDLSVLILDAHTDLADQYQGSRFSHACTTRRVLESAPAVLLGIRSIHEEAHDLIQRGIIPAFPRFQQPITNVAGIIANLTDNVYISVDLDVFDPSIMAAVGTPEPGGMGWWEVLAILRGVAEQRNIVGFDVMELAPAEGPDACAYTAAKLAYKLMAYAAAS